MLLAIGFLHCQAEYNMERLQSYNAELNHRWRLADAQTQDMSFSLQIMDPVVLECVLEGLGPRSRDKCRSWKGEEVTAGGVLLSLHYISHSLQHHIASCCSHLMSACKTSGHLSCSSYSWEPQSDTIHIMVRGWLPVSSVCLGSMAVE